MINLIKRNIFNFLDKIQFLIIPIVCEIIYLFLNWKKDSMLLIILGGYSNINNSFEISFMLLINLFYIIFGYYLYYYDFKFSSSIIFLRVNKIKWIISHYISLFIINNLITICFITFYLISQIIIKNHIDFYTLLMVLIINSIVKLLLQLLVISFNKIGIFISCILLLFPVFFNNNVSIFLDSILKNKWLIVVFILFIFITIVFNKKKFKRDIERI